MAVALGRPLIGVCAIGACVLQGGCAAPPPAPPPAPAPAPAVRRVLEGAYDWRNLAMAQFGSRLQDLAIPVHEVLLFGDRLEPADAADPVGEECYAPDAPVRHFIGRSIDSYLLCFANGRLDRIEAVVSLPAAAAADEFARSCDDWQAGTVAVDPRTAAHCTGTDAHGRTFSASLGESVDGASVPLAIIVSDSPFRKSP